MTSHLHIPADAVMRLHVLNKPLVAGFPFALMIARPPREAVPETLLLCDQVICILTVDAGIAMPNVEGCAIAAAVLDRGDTAGIFFAQLGDAMACKQRLTATRAGVQ